LLLVKLDRMTDSLIKLLYSIQRNTVTFVEIVSFLYKRTPPLDNNYLGLDYSRYVDQVKEFNQDKEKKPLFSVIIPTYNRPYAVIKTLNSIIRQTGIENKNFEIIIVDNGSQEIVAENIAQFIQKNNQSLTFIKLKNNYGPDLARNVGILASRGGLLAFTDDDCLVPPDWLLNFEKKLKSGLNIAGVGGWKEPYTESGFLDIYHRYTFWTHQFYKKPHDNLSYSHQSGYTANVCYQRNAVEKVGGFNIYFKRMGFHDFAIRMYKAHYRLLFESRSVKHEAVFSFKEIFSKSLLLGWDYYLLYVLHPRLWSKISFSFAWKRSVKQITAIMKEKKGPLLTQSIYDVVGFPVLVILTSFCFWLGKYWVLFTKEFSTKL